MSTTTGSSWFDVRKSLTAGYSVRTLLSMAATMNSVPVWSSECPARDTLLWCWLKSLWLHCETIRLSTRLFWSGLCGICIFVFLLLPCSLFSLQAIKISRNLALPDPCKKIARTQKCTSFSWNRKYLEKVLLPTENLLSIHNKTWRKPHHDSGRPFCVHQKKLWPEIELEKTERILRVGAPFLSQEGRKPQRHAK